MIRRASTPRQTMANASNVPMLTSCPTRPIGSKPREHHDGGPDHDGRYVGGAESRVHHRGHRWQQPVARHGVEDPGLAQQQDQDDGAQPENDADVHDRRKPFDADGVDADRDGIGHIELVVGNDAGEHQGDRHVERRADHERTENADRHVALRVDGLLRRGRNRVEADIGEEHHGGAADDAAPAEPAQTQIGRDECAGRVGRSHPVGGAEVPHADRDECDDDDELDGDEDGVELRQFTDADQQDGRHDGDHHHGGDVQDCAGRVPDALAAS